MSRRLSKHITDNTYANYERKYHLPDRYLCIFIQIPEVLFQLIPLKHSKLFQEQIAIFNQHENLESTQNI